jgi:phage tail sheath protein FI
MIEQSTKNAAKTYVFEPNDGGTWFAVRSMIENYLNGLWKEGALVGVAPSDAYQVSIGLGSTMTPNDVLEGIMRITVKVAISRPAEFIVITFQQKVQESAAAAE